MCFGYIHHGGANSYFEGARYVAPSPAPRYLLFLTLIHCFRAGKPQIVLPQWYDTYENASRVEYLGIRLYGNKNSAPDINATELGVAVARLTRDDEGETFRKRAKTIRKRCEEREGREKAADVVLEWLAGNAEFRLDKSRY